jgi:two-component system, NtrC family, sensor histidine kinase HydH
MSALPRRLHIPVGVQVGIVAALFVAALLALWTTGALVVARERRRADAKTLLDQAGAELAVRGLKIIARVGEFPDFPEETSRVTLERELSVQVGEALSGREGVEGGYFVQRIRGFVGLLPPAEADLIDIQVDAAIRKRQKLYSIGELEGDSPVTVAIRTEPLTVREHVVGATWVMTRLVDPLFLDRSLQGYRLAAGLALGGIALALALTAGLAQTVRAQAAERDRLQIDLRRSERLAALGKLLAGVAHEVRNPLAGIRSTAQLWQRGVVGLDDESLEGLVHEVDRLEEIVSRLLQFSRADAQDFIPGDLNAVVSEAARLAEGPAVSKGVRLEVDLQTDLPRVAMARSALLQVFRNLTANAVQAMAAGGTLRLTTRFDQPRQVVLAAVDDTGPGLAPEVIGHLFEPFFTTKAEGTGLGLAIAREIALAHRGDLRAANRPDRPGASFTIVLPVSPALRNGEPK